MEQLQEYLELLGDRPWLRAAVAVVAGFLAAFVIDWVFRKVLKALTRKTRSTFDDRLLALFATPVRTTVFLLGLWIAVQQLDLSPLDPETGEPANDYELWLRRGLATIGLIVWTVFAFRFTALLLRTLAKDERRVKAVGPTTLPLFDNLGKILLFGIAVYLLVRVWGGEVGPLLASAGVLGIAIGFAAQDTLANLFSGVFIIADSPYKVGDYIVLDSGERGKVVNIGLRSTRLLTRDDIEITIPNSVMGAARITNEAGGPATHRRLRVPVGVAYGSDIDAVERVMLEVAEAEELALAQPEPRVRFRAFGASSLDFELLVWIREPELRGLALHNLLRDVYKAFDRAGITIAFPQLDVHLHKT